MHFKKYLATLLLFTIVGISSRLPASPVISDLDIVKLVSNHDALIAGKTLFDEACAACHNKDLSGSTGFNLKDGEWVHGKNPKDIANNIQRGFSAAGMPAFKGIYSDHQIAEITAYILSKREGWDNLEYELYQLDPDADFSFDAISGKVPIKSGKLEKNIADYEIPEIKNYALIFKGDFYAPDDVNGNIVADFPPRYINMDISINNSRPKKFKKTALRKGKQKLVIRMITLERLIKKNQRKNPKTNIGLQVKGRGGRTLFAASTRGMEMMTASVLNVDAENSPLVLRKRVLDLPPFSIVVGLPEKFNYAFDAKTCSISGAWSGNLLDIGPNVTNRGNDGSLITGQWIFHSPDEITPMSTTQGCRFKRYSRLANPEFYYSIDHVEYTLSAKSFSGSQLEIKYNVIANPKKIKTISFQLPANSKKYISADRGSIKNGLLHVNIENNPEFNIILNKHSKS